MAASALATDAAASTASPAAIAAEPPVVSNAHEPKPPSDHGRGRHGPTKPGGPVDAEPDPPGPKEKIVSPPALNLYRAAGFRYQDTNYYACTATSAMDMLNFIALNGSGGSGFAWSVSLSATKRDAILAWERTHDTMSGGNGSDPHGWRNALNLYGWGSGSLGEGSRHYEDYAFSSYGNAIRAAIRAMVRYRKPVGIVAWQGRHAQMLTGYDGLVGDPFALDAAGHYTNAFTLTALFLSDPLMSSEAVNKRIGYTTLGTSSNLRFRFQPYYETDSPYDDPYTAGYRRSRDEWYARWVIISPVR